MKTKNYLIVLFFLLNLQIIEAQHFICQTIINGSDTGFIFTTTNPEVALGKMALHDIDVYVFENSQQVNGAAIYSVAYTDKKNGWAIGTMESCSVNCGVIFSTTDGGKSWNLQYKSGTAMRFNSLGFDKSENIVVSGTRTIGDKSFDTTLATNDGGQTWLEGVDLQSKLDSKAIALNTEN